jgi:uncharacterized membrane protein YbjE (DUF340 family)
MSEIVIKISQNLARELYAFATAPRIVAQTMSNASREELAAAMHPILAKAEKKAAK